MKYKLILEGYFIGSKGYWKQELYYDSIEQIKEQLKMRTDYSNFEVYKIEETKINI